MVSLVSLVRPRARRAVTTAAVVLGLLLPFAAGANAAQARTANSTSRDTRVVSLWLCAHRASYVHSHHYMCTHPAAARQANALAARRAAAARHAIAPRPAFTPVIGDATERGIEWAVQNMLNSERAAHGLGRVVMNHNLCMSAHSHNLTMSRFNTMSHQLPGEADFGAREDAAGYHWLWAGENIAWNSNVSLNGVLELQQGLPNTC